MLVNPVANAGEHDSRGASCVVVPVPQGAPAPACGGLRDRGANHVPDRHAEPLHRRGIPRRGWSASMAQSAQSLRRTRASATRSGDRTARGTRGEPCALRRRAGAASASSRGRGGRRGRDAVEVPALRGQRAPANLVDERPPRGRGGDLVEELANAKRSAVVFVEEAAEEMPEEDSRGAVVRTRPARSSPPEREEGVDLWRQRRRGRSSAPISPVRARGRGRRRPTASGKARAPSRASSSALREAVHDRMRDEDVPGRKRRPAWCSKRFRAGRPREGVEVGGKRSGRRAGRPGAVCGSRRDAGRWTRSPTP